MSEQINQANAQLEMLKGTEDKAKSIIHRIQQEIDESAQVMATQNAEHQKRKQELEDQKKLALKSLEEKYLKENAELEAKNRDRRGNFAKGITNLKEQQQLKEKIDWNQVDLVMVTFTYTPSSQTLGFGTSMHSSDKSQTIAELIFWYWGDKDIVILIMKKTAHAFGVKSHTISVPTNGSTPVNKKFNIVIRFLDEQILSENNSLEPYYGNYEGVETVTLSVCGTDNKNTSFVVPKYVLMNASPVFQRMFANEMTEKATGEVEIKDTNPHEFGDFLKAISPRQEYPNPSNVSLLHLANRYQCQSLRDRCEEHLVNSVEFSLVERLNLVELYRLDNLKANLIETLSEIWPFELSPSSEADA